KFRHGGGQGGQGGLFFCTDRNDLFKIRLQGGLGGGGGAGQVLLVEDGQRRTPPAAAGDGEVGFVQGLGGVEHRQHQPGLVELFPAAADALGLDGVAPLPHVPHPGGVEEVQAD